MRKGLNSNLEFGMVTVTGPAEECYVRIFMRLLRNGKNVPEFATSAEAISGGDQFCRTRTYEHILQGQAKIHFGRYSHSTLNFILNNKIYYLREFI